MRVLFLLTIVLTGAVGAGAAPLLRIGVAPARFDDRGPDESGADVDAVTVAVARGLGVGPLQVVTAAEVAAIAVRAARSGLVCDARDAPCAARLAAFSDLDFIVVTRHFEDGGPAIELTLIDGHDGKTMRQRQAPLPEADGVAASVEAVATALLQDAPVPGRLEVRGPAGAAIDIDGVTRGVAPVGLEVGAGLHRVNGRVVRVPAAGTTVIDTASSDVDVTMGLAVTTGVGAALALGAGIGAVVVAPDAARRDAYTARGYNDAVATGQALIAAAVVGVGVAVVGGGLWAATVLLHEDEPG